MKLEEIKTEMHVPSVLNDFSLISIKVFRSAASEIFLHISGF
jgi:hypothetical protein